MESNKNIEHFQLQDNNSDIITFMKKECPNISEQFLHMFTFSVELDEIGYINSDDLEIVLGYKKRQNYLNLIKSNGIINTDYFENQFHLGEVELKRGKKREVYNLTPDFARTICILSQKKEVSEYFITVERLFKIFMKKYYTTQLKLKDEENKLQLKLKDEEIKIQLKLKEEEIKKEMTIKHDAEIEQLRKTGFIYYIKEINPSLPMSKFADDYRYIGMTTRTIPERVKEHYSTAMNSLKSSFYRAIFENG